MACPPDSERQPAGTVRALLLLGGSPGGKQQVRLLLTPRLPPPPCPASRQQRPAAGSAAVLQSQRQSAVHGCVQPAQQQQQPSQQQALGRGGLGRGRASPSRELSSYSDLAGGAAVFSPGSGRGGRHLPVSNAQAAAGSGSSSDNAGHEQQVEAAALPQLKPAATAAAAASAAAGKGQSTLHPAPLLDQQWLAAYGSLLAQLNDCLAAFAARASCSSSAASGSLALAPLFARALQHKPSVMHGSCATPTLAAQVLQAAKAVPMEVDGLLCPFELRGSCKDAACR